MQDLILVSNLIYSVCCILDVYCTTPYSDRMRPIPSLKLGFYYIKAEALKLALLPAEISTWELGLGAGRLIFNRQEQADAWRNIPSSALLP
jgi:hypothetical protein